MPLFEFTEGELAPFRRLQGGAELHEKEIEALLWGNVEEFTGDTLFPVTRQAKLSTGGIPDVVALDRTGRVVVFEVKRDIDRRQLAQCLEYAGWALKAATANDFEAFKKVAFSPVFLDTIINQMNANEEIFKLILADERMRGLFTEFIGRSVYDRVREHSEG